jgi:hypothetical protein
MALQQLSEPSLPAVAARNDVARVVVVPPFPSRRIVVVRVVLVGQAMEVHSKVLSNWFPNRGKVQVFPVRKLPTSHWSSIEASLIPGLWSFHPAPFPDPRIQDGSVWFLESSGLRGHVAVIQHVPGPSPFREACEDLLRLSTIEFTEQEFISWFTY